MSTPAPLSLDSAAFSAHVRRLGEASRSPCVLDISAKAAGNYPTGAFELIEHDLAAALGAEAASVSVGALEAAGVRRAFALRRVSRPGCLQCCGCRA